MQLGRGRFTRLIIGMVFLPLFGCGGGGSGSGSTTGFGSGGVGAGSSNFADDCSSHADCGSRLVCVTNACQSAFPRTYIITFDSAQVSKYKASGNSWDTLGGAPDPRAALLVDGDILCQTSTDQDTFDPVWNEACEVLLYESSEVVFALWDMDLADHDPIGSVSGGTPLSDSIIKAGQLGALAAGYEIEAWSIRVRLK